MSGDDIRKEIEKRKGTRPSSGTIYPVLKSLHEKGLIEETKDSGKIKRYKLSKEGKKELDRTTRKFVDMFFDMKDEFKNCSMRSC